MHYQNLNVCFTNMIVNFSHFPLLTSWLYFFPPPVQVAPTSSKQHGVNVGVNASATPFQQASGYGSHGYSTGESLNNVETACLRGCASILGHRWLCADSHNEPIDFPIGGVRISFERCNICKHNHGARVMAFVILVSRHLLMVYESFLWPGCWRESLMFSWPEHGLVCQKTHLHLIQFQCLYTWGKCLSNSSLTTRMHLMSLLFKGVFRSSICCLNRKG